MPIEPDAMAYLVARQVGPAFAREVALASGAASAAA